MERIAAFQSWDSDNRQVPRQPEDKLLTSPNTVPAFCFAHEFAQKARFPGINEHGVYQVKQGGPAKLIAGKKACIPIGKLALNADHKIRKPLCGFRRYMCSEGYKRVYIPFKPVSDQIFCNNTHMGHAHYSPMHGCHAIIVLSVC